MALDFNPFEETKEQEVKKPKARKKRSKKYEHFKAFESSDLEGNKPSVNHEPTVSQPSAQAIVNHQPTVSQPSVDSSVNHQLKNKKSVNHEPTVSQPSAQAIVNHQPTVSQPSVGVDLNMVVGKKLTFIKFIFNQCRISGAMETHPITNDMLVEVLKASIGGIRTLIWELKRDGYIDYKSLKKGRVGLRKFSVPKTIYQQLLVRDSFSQPSVNSPSTISPGVSQPSANWSVESSSSNKELLNNTSNLITGKELPEEFKEIQVPQILKDCGFGKTQLKQLHKMEEFSIEEIQSSLEQFSYDLEEGNLRIKSTPLNFLMGTLRKGGAYVSSAFIEQERKEIEEYTKKAEDLKKLKENAQEAFIQREFEEWLSGINPEDYGNYIEYNDFVKKGTQFEKAFLRMYWDKEIKGI